MANDFPNVRALGLEVLELRSNIIGQQSSQGFDVIRAEPLERLLAKGVRVYSSDKTQITCWLDYNGDASTHTALLIAIEPVKRETAEDLLPDLIEIMRSAECELSLSADHLRTHGDNYSAENKEKSAGRLQRAIERARKVMGK